MSISVTSFRALTRFKCSKHTFLRTTNSMAAPPTTTVSFSVDSPLDTYPSIEDTGMHNIKKDATPAIVSLQEWQAWGTDSPIPTHVAEIVDEMIDLERQSDTQMKFGGLGGKLKVYRKSLQELKNVYPCRIHVEDELAVDIVVQFMCMPVQPCMAMQGDFKTQEDKKHRAKYKAFDDPEQKLHFFSARQIACRLLGSRGYLCQKCWLPFEDCMCSKVVACDLWHRIRFWLYMHPKDFLRQNNTGKLLWQVFGTNAAKLCLFGIAEHEDIMWKAFMQAGRNNVWCLYPNKNVPAKSVEDSFAGYVLNYPLLEPHQTDAGEMLNFILIDGTWSNSAAMFRRLKERSDFIWGEDLNCISLATGASAMHKLRPQPSWDRTCTAAAAIGLLDELHLSQFNSFGLDKQAEAVENSADVLLASLTSRRIRMGRSITRRQRHHNDIC